MKEEFVTYDQALALKELGFDEPCLAFFQVENFENKPCGVDDKDEYIRTGFATCKNSEIPKHYTSSPLKQQVFRWFRNTFQIQSLIQDYLLDTYMYTVDDGLYSDISVVGIETYEKAEQACIDEIIKIIKNKKEWKELR
jgi:hypothetical protein